MSLNAPCKIVIGKFMYSAFLSISLYVIFLCLRPVVRDGWPGVFVIQFCLILYRFSKNRQITL